MGSRSALLRLAAAALALAALAPAFERHDGGGHLERAAGYRVVEASALHSAAAAHVEAAGARDADSCDLCARLASAGAALGVPLSGVEPAAAADALRHPILVSPGSIARLGAPAGRAPPLA